MEKKLLNFEITQEDYQVIKKASTLIGISECGFVRSSAMERARKILIDLKEAVSN